jgi:hypothetical protein
MSQSPGCYNHITGIFSYGVMINDDENKGDEKYHSLQINKNCYTFKSAAY